MTELQIAWGLCVLFMVVALGSQAMAGKAIKQSRSLLKEWEESNKFYNELCEKLIEQLEAERERK